MALTIGKLADAAGVNIETVRYYERRGLLPEPPRSASGYRQYSDDDVWRLQFIARGKRLGFTLNEIRDLMADGRGAPEDVLRAARRKLTAVAERERELHAMRVALEGLARLCESDDPDCATLTVTERGSQQAPQGDDRDLSRQ